METANSLRNGVSLLLESSVNKGLAFSSEERQKLGLAGLLPPSVRGQDLQVKAVIEQIRSIQDPLTKYVFLRNLQDNNQRLFFQTVQTYTEELLPIVYTPIVGLACQKYSLIYARPRGLFITANDAGRIATVLANWPVQDVKAIVVTDGERILGLGDLGANGMGIPVGKLALYTAIGGCNPDQTLPITIDVGTNNEELLSDKLYIGLRQKRLRGQQYDDLLDEFMKAVVNRWGKTCLIQFEDFGNANAFRLLEKYQHNYCTFNDDIQGTASVTVAGILSSLKITKGHIRDQRILFFGAGEAALGCAELLVMQMRKNGLSEEEAKEKLWLVDSRGLITVGRPSGGITTHKATYARQDRHIVDLEEIIDHVKPTCIVGVSAVPGSFTPKLLKSMAKYNNRPIVFALSNPTSKAECTAEQAYTCTDGRCVFASGSPFDPVKMNGTTFYPGQGNNSYIFPAVGFATICCEPSVIETEAFLVAAQALADLVSDSDLQVGRVYPPLSNIFEISFQVACKVADYFYEKGFATYPKPGNLHEYMRSKLYRSAYDGAVNGISRM